MKNTLKNLFNRTVLILSLFAFGFILFLLYVTQDEVNADLSNVEEKLNQYYNKDKMGGFVVSVFTADSVIYSKGFGYADVENQVPYSGTTQQYIASISKTTIGIALMKAQELDLLKLDDPINEHLPFEVTNPNHPDQKITVRHLATHTSSLDYNEAVVESLYIPANEEHPSLQSFMEDYFQNNAYQEVKHTDHLPGNNWNYSNIGAGLAAFIIEHKSGMSFANFTQKYIFDPLNLNHTAWFRSEVDSTNHTKYYESDSASIYEVNTSGVKLYPCRDMITNIGDLTKYCQAIMSKDPAMLQKASFEELLQPNIPNTVSNQEMDNNGIFFLIDRNQYGITYQLTGGTGGDNCINTTMLFDPKTQLGYIFIGNTGQTERSRANHILIHRTLVSLGDHMLMNQPDSSFSDRLTHKMYNWYSRVRAFF